MLASSALRPLHNKSIVRIRSSGLAIALLKNLFDIEMLKQHILAQSHKISLINPTVMTAIRSAAHVELN
jgi:hypothetical protein